MGDASCSVVDLTADDIKDFQKDFIKHTNRNSSHLHNMTAKVFSAEDGLADVADTIQSWTDPYVGCCIRSVVVPVFGALRIEMMPEPSSPL